MKNIWLRAKTHLNFNGNYATPVTHHTNPFERISQLGQTPALSVIGVCQTDSDLLDLPRGVPLNEKSAGVGNRNRFRFEGEGGDNDNKEYGEGFVLLRSTV